MQNEFLKSLLEILERDLSKLESEINLYPDEDSIWKLQGEIKNSGGTLCLHICGNLQHFIGAILGNSGYVRNREHEFAARNVPRADLIKEISQTKTAVRSALEQLNVEALTKDFPIEVFGKPMTTMFFLIHLAGHLNYHLGQVNYHRRIIAG